MKNFYITILERENGDEAKNVGTITTSKIDEGFKKAIESHFDAELLGFKFTSSEIEYLEDCVGAYPIDVEVKLNNNGEEVRHLVELSQTWLY